jgi:hypothetical protein
MPQYSRKYVVETASPGGRTERYNAIRKKKEEKEKKKKRKRKKTLSSALLFLLLTHIPSPQIKSLDKMIDNLELNLSKNPQEKDDLVHEIDLLKSKKTEIIQHPDILGTFPTSLLIRFSSSFFLAFVFFSGFF